MHKSVVIRYMFLVMLICAGGTEARAQDPNIIATAGANGTISPSGTVVVTSGSNQAFTITPSTGYDVDSVLVDGVRVDSTTSYTFVNVTTDHTIRAVFRINTYTITSSAGANGTISPLGAVGLDHGSNQAFTITPSTGYHIDSVLVDGIRVDSTTSYTFVNVTTDHTIRAVFRINQYTITSSAGPNGTITPAGAIGVNHGSNQAFTITPSTGYHIDSVLVDGVRVDSTTSYTFVNVTTDHTIRAVFRINTYTITSSAGPNGTITPAGAIGVNHGSNQAFTITPSTGYHIDSVLVDGVRVDSTTSYMFVNVTTDHTIRAVFRINTYTISSSSGPNGTISPLGAVNLNHGSNQAFAITPITGYHVDSLLIDGVRVDSTTSYTFVNVTTDHTIRAVFRINEYTITASTGANGSITPAGAIGVNHGSSQGFTITPSTGYHIDSVLVDGIFVGVVGSYTFTLVTSDHTIRATFAINTYTITSSAGPNGTIAPLGVINVNHGTNRVYTMTPSAGYHVDSLLIDGVKVDSTTSYTFVGVATNHTIRAVFSINQYTINATAGPNGTISPSGIVGVSHGASQSFTITPSIGYHIDSVLVDGVAVGAVGSYTFTLVTSNHTISATFAINTYAITASAGPNGTIAPLGVTTVSHGSSQSFTITPSTGYHVDSLLVDGVRIDSTTSYTFNNITVGHTIRAVFRINMYTITASAGANGSITPAGAIGVDHGSSQAFTIAPSTGYHIDSVLVDGVRVDSTTSYVFTNVTTNHTIRAVFRINAYTITATAGANGAISPAGVVGINFGSNQLFTMIPSVGYHVDSVLVDGIRVDSTTSYTFVNVTADHTIRVVFRMNEYTITSSAGSNGTITPLGVTNVIHGANQAFNISATAGYHVDSVLVDGARVDSTTSYTFVNVTSTHTIRVVFRINQYTITSSAGANGTINPSGAVGVDHGSNRSFTITPSTGYHIDSVVVDGVRVDSTTSYTFVNVTTDHTIRAVFRINQYTITATAGLNGTISPSGMIILDHGSSQPFTMIPSTGYHVDSVIVDGVRVDSTTSYTFVNVATSHTIRVVFRINQYTIAATSGLNGAITPSGVINLVYGSSQTFTIAPSTGYHVDSVLVDGVRTDSTTSYTFVSVTTNHTIRAVFQINQYTITATAGPNGTINPSGVINLTHGSNQTFTITPSTGYHADSVIVDGVPLDSPTDYTFLNVIANHTIRVVFRLNQYTISATAGANGSITPSGAVSVNHGSNQAFAIAPSAGYHIDSVLVDGVRVDSTTSYTFINVTTGHSIRAVFRINQYVIVSSAGINGGISPVGTVGVNHGSSQTFTITPSAGYHVDSVLVDGFRVDSTTSYTFVNVTTNHAIRAVFRINQYAIIALAGPNGVISPEGTISVNHGSSQSFTISPSTGYHVDSVLVDGIRVDSTSGYTFVNVTTGHTIRVVFRINQYTITATTGANGVIVPSGPVIVTHGLDQTFAIIPATGYHVESLLVDGVEVDSTTSYTFVNVTANHTIRAVFRIVQYTITPLAGANGSISPGAAVSVNHGSTIAFTMIPVPGYHVDSVFVDGVRVDSTTSYTFVNVTANHTIRATFIANQIMVVVIMNQGWNLIANPVTNPINGDSVKQLYPTSLNPYAFEFNGTYSQTYRLLNGRGYWEKFRTGTFNAITGSARTHDSINVVTGWNLVGSISYSIDTSTIVSVPPGLRVSRWFGYSGGYTAATNLNPGKGYWVKSSGEGKFVFSHSPLAKSSKTVASGGDELRDLNTLTITDREGGAQTLYFGADAAGEIPVSMYSMPPTPPMGAFDARFESADGGTMVQTHETSLTSALEFPVTIQSDAYPLTITWKIQQGGGSYQLTDGQGGIVFHVHQMQGQDSMIITNSNVNRLSLRLASESSVPAEFALSQNYPNPFNPSTTINYDLPKDSRVTLKLFTVLGEEVATLVNDDQKAGYRSVQWNASAFATGVYFYRLQAGDFVASRKLLLLR